MEQPLWEGFDEWAHFAAVRHVAEHGVMPFRSDRIAQDIQESLFLAPLSQAAASAIPGSMTHDQFWKLPEEQRSRLQKELRGLPAGGNRATPTEAMATQYEAQQPPLYYLLLAPVMWAVRGFSLIAQVLWVRVASALIASAIVPLCFFLSRSILSNEKLALLAALLSACLPGLLIDVCRVGNDSLAIVIGAAIILYTIKASRAGAGLWDWVVLGLLMGAGLLTKAYLAAFLPLLPMAAISRITAEAGKRRIAEGCVIAILICLTIGGWWYVHAWLTTGTISGEQLDAEASRFTWAHKLSSVAAMDWSNVLDTAVRSHIWTGGWSFLAARKWMYRVWELVGVAAAAGLFAGVLKPRRTGSCETSPSIFRRDVILVASAWGLIVLVMGYHSLLLFLTRNASAAQGWYLYPAIAAELTLIACGFRGLFGKRWAPGSLALICLLAIALDLYGLHCLLAPYYTGILSHNAQGGLALAQPAARNGFAVVLEVLQRLSASKPAAIGPLAMAVLWSAYLIATAALATLGVLLGRRGGIGSVAARNL